MLATGNDRSAGALASDFAGADLHVQAVQPLTLVNRQRVTPRTCNPTTRTPKYRSPGQLPGQCASLHPLIALRAQSQIAPALDSLRVLVCRIPPLQQRWSARRADHKRRRCRTRDAQT